MRKFVIVMAAAAGLGLMASSGASAAPVGAFAIDAAANAMGAVGGASQVLPAGQEEASVDLPALLPVRLQEGLQVVLSSHRDGSRAAAGPAFCCQLAIAGGSAWRMTAARNWARASGSNVPRGSKTCRARKNPVSAKP